MNKFESINSGANYIRFLGEMEEKQVRQCQAAWQLNHRKGLCFLFLPAYRSNTGFFSTSDQTNEIFRKYYYNGRDAVETKP